MAVNTLEDAFLEELQDCLSAERQITKALPKMAKKASEQNLQQAFTAHLQETEKQIERLEQVFETLNRKPRAKRCAAMEGILEEGKEIMEKKVEAQTLDALMIAAAQKVEHYEIATYGTLCTWAKQLNHDSALELLKENLSEEVDADKKLSTIAERVNQAAAVA